LSKMTRPDVTLITTVAAAHLEAFDNIEGIALEKASVMEGLEYGGVSVMNNDIDTAAILQAKAHDLKRRDVGFGEHGFDYVLKDVQIIGDTTIVQAEANEQPLLFKIATAGRHFAMNGLGALAACEALGADLALAAGSLGRWSPFEGRGAREVIVLDPVETHLTLELIDDSYNANPTSLAASLEVLAAAAVTNNTGRVAKGRRIAYLGDMKELGSQAVALHIEMATHSAAAELDTIHCVGPLMKAMYDALPEAQKGRWTETSAEMVQGIRRDLDAGDVVLAKGSLSMKLGLVVDAIRKMGHSTTPTA
jgi:UDP-N-acetylmuramoyl-tripeptide--D-alanyl-D-alanine ligase